jgi:hypothetical protein
MYRILKYLILFLLLSSWIVFLSLTAQVFYSPSVFEQNDAINKCLMRVEPEKRELYINFLFEKNGNGHTILMKPTHNYQSSLIVCTLRDGEVVMFVGGR